MSGEPETKRSTMSALEQLKKMTVIVADTGDFEGKYNSDPAFPGISCFPEQFLINRALCMCRRCATLIVLLSAIERLIGGRQVERIRIFAKNPRSLSVQGHGYTVMATTTVGCTVKVVRFAIDHVHPFYALISFRLFNSHLRMTFGRNSN